MTTAAQIPFLDLATPHRDLEPELSRAFSAALHSASFVGGPVVEEFERSFADFVGASHCVGVASGTDAVLFGLLAAGVKPADVVLTVPHTFIATAEAITQAGAQVDFVDIDSRTYCMDPASLEKYLAQQCELDPTTGKPISRKFRKPVTAIVPVHLYGQMADMDPLLDLAKRYNLLVIEDACQAHGAQYFSRAQNRWISAGTLGAAAAFSFYPGKNLGACGEAGAVTTNSEAVSRSIRMLRDHGQTKKYYHSIEGYNGRLDAIQAGILSVKLRYLPEWNRRRNEVAKIYSELLSSLPGITLPHTEQSSRHVFHLYVIQVEDRAALQKHLAAVGIGTGIHYPIPLHLQEAYRHLGYAVGDFPVTESVASRILSLPMYPQLATTQIERVANEIGRFLGSDNSRSPLRAAHELQVT
ncbi:MAG TPA: DegT/DnrJ/EryC1/StrS family aminotransferase [Candidatus Acidoferrales bacterium]|nr:DegT/DnrJ/EryC1/StrS family aminotransferase [Candidatus Acidoferrales bacterium]